MTDRAPLLAQDQASVNSVETGTSDDAASPSCFSDKRRRRWIFLFGVVAVLSLAVVLALEVGGKELAQEALDNSEMDIKSMTVTAIGTDTLTLDVEVDVDNRYPVSAKLHPFTVAMEFEGGKIGTVGFPTVSLQASALNSLSLEGQTLTITDQSVFDAFASALFDTASVTVTLKGSVKASADGLTYTLDVNKDIPLVGVNAFSDPLPFVESVSLNSSHADGMTMDLTVQLTSAATVGFQDIGGLNLTLIYEGFWVGYAYCIDSPVAIAPGTHGYHFRAELIRTPANAQAVADAMGGLASGLTLSLTLQGNADSTPYPLLSGAFSALSLDSSLDGLAVLETQPHPFVMFNKYDTENSTWSELSDQVLWSFDAVRAQNAGQALFQQVFGYFQPVANAKKNPECEGQSTHQMSTMIHVLMSSPLPFPATLVGFAIDVYWAGDPDATALGYPEFQEPMLYGTGTNWKTEEDPVLVVGPYGTHLQGQLLCVAGAMDSFGTLMDFITGYLPARYTPGKNPLYLGVSESSFELTFNVNATMTVKIGELLMENVPYSAEAVSSINIVNGSG